MQAVTAVELAHWIGDASRPAPVLLDVREPWEFAICRLEGAVQMPMNAVPARHEELDRDAAIVCVCHHGARSAQVASFLERSGFEHVINLTGGMHAWALQVDPTMPTY